MAIINYPAALKQMKTQLALSDNKLAKYLGVSGNSIYNWTKGIRNPTGVNKIKVDKVLSQLGISNNTDDTSIVDTTNPLNTPVSYPLEHKTFHIEVEGIRRTHSRNITLAQWAEIMSILGEV